MVVSNMEEIGRMKKLLGDIEKLRHHIKTLPVDEIDKESFLYDLNRLVDKANSCNVQMEITEHELKEKQLKCDFYEAALDALPNPIFLKNGKGEFVYFNEEYQKYFHMEREEYLNKTVLDLEFLPMEERERYQAEDLKLIETGTIKHYEINFELANGAIGNSLYWSNGFQVPSSGDKGLVGEIVDISIQKKLQDEVLENAQKLEEANKSIERMMKEDFLTGLYNRRAIDEIMSKMHYMLQNNTTKICILMADLDDFKRVNDTYGHGCGDEILVKFSEVLKSCNRRDDLVVRFGGEEFLVVLFGVNSTQASVVAERIRKMTEQTLVLPNGKTNTVSIGVTEISQDEMFNCALERVDQALYTAKLSGKNKVIVKETEE